MPAPKGIFKPVVPGAAVATLVLIENSQSMVHGWPDLRDHHLPTLLGTMRLANPIVPIQVLWLITSPASEDDSGPSRNGKELPDIRFDLNPTNKISTSIIERGITLLASTFNGEVAARHLILVAASGPSDADLCAGGGYGFRWQQLAYTLREENIFLHVILNPAQNMETYSGLFYDTLTRQNHEEVHPWFRANLSRYQFRLAGTPVSTSPHCPAPCDPELLDMPENPPMLHSYTYPSDSATSPTELGSGTSTPQAEVVMPSLVSRLQKMHGLTKKKIYGSQPTRQPFVREERIRDKYRQVPTPLSIPSASSPPPIPKSPSADLRMPLKSKTDRARRMSAQGRITNSTPESIGNSGRRSPWFRRDSRPVLPTDSGSGSYPSSPTSVSSLNTNSPALPTPHDFDTVGTTAIGTVSAPWEPSWLEDQTEQYSSTNASRADPVYEQGIGVTEYPRSPLPSLTPMSSFAPEREKLESTSLSTLNANVEQHELIGSGDQPFIFSPEYEAAATARFQAIFQPTPLRTETPDLTSRNSYPETASASRRNYYYHSPGNLSPMSFSSTLANLSYHIPSQSATLTATKHDAPKSYVSGGSSSLEGWDGRYPL